MSKQVICSINIETKLNININNSAFYIQDISSTDWHPVCLE